MIKITKSNLHWNYFLALEQDMTRTARYIEFHDENLAVFSIELAHLLFAAASEVDVLTKCICRIIKPDALPKKRDPNMNDYRNFFTNAAKLPAADAGHVPSFTKMEISIPRYGMKL